MKKSVVFIIAAVVLLPMMLVAMAMKPANNSEEHPAEKVEQRSDNDCQITSMEEDALAQKGFDLIIQAGHSSEIASLIDRDTLIAIGRGNGEYDQSISYFTEVETAEGSEDYELVRISQEEFSRLDHDGISEIPENMIKAIMPESNGGE